MSEHEMWAIVMAGGAGTRFWPLSTPERPKQLLPLLGDEPMVATSVRRLAPLIPPERVIVVTGASIAERVAAALPQIPRENILVEPVGRNTAPCIGLATHLVASRSKDADAVIGVFAADHFVADVPRFLDDVVTAATAATPGAIVTLGVRPSRPETGYGYILSRGDGDVREVERFVEKPDRDTALKYLADGRYLWNAGLFFFRASTMLDEIDRQLPELATGLAMIQPDLGQTCQDETIAKHFPSLPSVSIDYGVMEGAATVVVVVTSCGWSDVGHWAAMPEVFGVDDAGNTRIGAGESVVLDAGDNVVFANDRMTVGLIDVSGLVVVATDQTVLVSSRDSSQRVREIVAELASGTQTES